ncbi:putative beta-calactosidase [Mollisia scopiformis]|uniref:Beta-galactosidase n=1 Tax=Mollisia scopiformis TaxID=149040 RepID=A0A194XES8_MOLSC|nr:putative beta-calactosidase [Mollisia scopiformis]KUJ18695.1 putative beta-calactosidase [Mollisia scopiformis]
MRVSIVLSGLLGFGRLVSSAYTNASVAFTYNRTSFLLHGESYQMIGGQMDPHRIPYQYWEKRLYAARAMGLNTIFSYIFWDQVQPSQDTWDFSGRNNIAEYFRLAQEIGLHIVLRAGPYVCGEHEWGGYPYWLSNIPGMVVRSNNAPFLNASKVYLDRLAEEIRPMLVQNGGPILMAQIENEYGSYGADHVYMEALRDLFYGAFGDDMVLYTNDGGYSEDILNGQIEGILAETDGGPQSGFLARDQYAYASSLGPQLDGEYYITWLDLWASNSTYDTDAGDTTAIESIVSDLSWTLNNGSSFSLYMFHGGTNWGFQNGADWAKALTPVITSYDYGAPLTESGGITDIYLALREMIVDYLGNETLPAVPKNETPIAIPEIALKPVVKLFDILPEPVVADYPTNMEKLGQSHGFILYRHTVTSSVSGILVPGDYPRDRVLVYVNQTRVGIIDSIYQAPAKVNLTLEAGDVLDILVENMGRVNYGPRIPDQIKGIVGNVTMGESILKGWEMYNLPLELPSASSSMSTLELASSSLSNSGPLFYAGMFDVEGEIADTFLHLANWTKGVVWVNGENLGRYWTVGPQQTLYLPGCYLKKEGNEIVVLNLEPSEEMGAVNGVVNRLWGNNPDPDAP